MSNIALTLGGEHSGAGAKTDLTTWQPHPILSLSNVTDKPERISHHVYSTLLAKGMSIRRTEFDVDSVLCLYDSWCEDGDHCTVNSCIDSVCQVVEILDVCLGYTRPPTPRPSSFFDGKPQDGNDGSPSLLGFSPPSDESSSASSDKTLAGLPTPAKPTLPSIPPLPTRRPTPRPINFFDGKPQDGISGSSLPGLFSPPSDDRRRRRSRCREQCRVGGRRQKRQCREQCRVGGRRRRSRCREQCRVGGRRRRSRCRGQCRVGGG